jgi:hypothetical protein
VPSTAYRTHATRADDEERASLRARLVRILWRNPRDLIGIVAALGATAAILINALYLQPGPHPAPIFAVKSRPVMPPEPTGSIMLPRPRPADLAKPEIPTRSVAAPTAPTRSDPIADLIAPSPRRIMAVQRALSEYGYGPIKPTGVLGADTKAGIEKFERERKLPITGQITERLIRELSAVTGRSLE